MVSDLRRVLFALVGGDGPDIPQYAGRALPGLSEGDHSVCYVSKKSQPPPDVVVAADTRPNEKWRVVRREYSDRYPSEPVPRRVYRLGSVFSSGNIKNNKGKKVKSLAPPLHVYPDRDPSGRRDRSYAF